MLRQRILFLAAIFLLSSCASMNPYTEASKHVLQHYSATFCWAPAGAENSAKSCRNDAAVSAFNACMAELRPTGHWWGPDVDTANANLIDCMEKKGWQHLFIKGAILG
jgi:hypothetical protein